MERHVIVELLTAAETRLAETEAQIWRQREALVGLLNSSERSEAMRLIETLQKERLELALGIQRLHDELDSSAAGGG
jgi:hypothetical protein